MKVLKCCLKEEASVNAAASICTLNTCSVQYTISDFLWAKGKYVSSLPAEADPKANFLFYNPAEDISGHIFSRVYYGNNGTNSCQKSKDSGEK